jgi:hypothetical protein
VAADGEAGGCGGGGEGEVLEGGDVLGFEACFCLLGVGMNDWGMSE